MILGQTHGHRLDHIWPHFFMWACHYTLATPDVPASIYILYQRKTCPMGSFSVGLLPPALTNLFSLLNKLAIYGGGGGCEKRGKDIKGWEKQEKIKGKKILPRNTNLQLKAWETCTLIKQPRFLRPFCIRNSLYSIFVFSQSIPQGETQSLHSHSQ